VKKTFLLFALFAAAAPAFAADGGSGHRRMAVTMYVNALAPMLDRGFGMGLGFEFAPIPYASVRVGVTCLAFSTAAILRFNLNGRWYPQGNASGWFFSYGLQFQRSSLTPPRADDGETRARDWWGALSAFFGAGNKIVFENERRAAFAMDPTLDWGFRLGGRDAEGRLDNWLIGVSGPQFRLPVGVAF